MVETVEKQLETAVKDLKDAQEGFRQKAQEIEGAVDKIGKQDKTLSEVSEKVHELKELFGQKAGLEELEKLSARLDGIEVESKRPKNDGYEHEDYGFKNLGDYISTVLTNPRDKRVTKWMESKEYKALATGAPSGSLVPTRFMPNRILGYEDPFGPFVRPFATVIPAGTPPDGAVTIPSLDQDQTDGSVWEAGMTGTWIAEAGTKVDTDIKLKEITLTPREAAASTIITDKMLRNNTIIESFIRAKLAKVMDSMENTGFFSGVGSGSNQPLGFSSHTSSLGLTRVAAGNNVDYGDVVNMIAQFYPGPGSVWVINKLLMPDILNLVGPTGNVVHMFHTDAKVAMGQTLFGIPIKWTDVVSVAGTRGDINLCAMSYYIIKDGSGPYIDTSPHVHFLTNRTVIKVFWNVDGRPQADDAIRPRTGTTDLSPFVQLADAV